MVSKVSVDDVNIFFESAFPDDPPPNIASGDVKEGSDTRPKVLVMEEGRSVIRMNISARNKRPGNYISGPTQMGLADQIAYAVIFTQLGIVPMAVTSNLNMNFLRPCIGSALLGEGRMIKLGRTLAVIEVEIRAENETGEPSDKVASHAIVTYAIPQAG